MRHLHQGSADERPGALALIELDALLERREGLGAAALIGQKGCGTPLPPRLEKRIAGTLRQVLPGLEKGGAGLPPLGSDTAGIGELRPDLRPEVMPQESRRVHRRNRLKSEAGHELGLVVGTRVANAPKE